MKKSFALIALLPLLYAGCRHPENSLVKPEKGDDGLQTDMLHGIDTEDTLFREISPCLQFDDTVQRSDVRPAGSIAREDCQRWARLAEVRVQLQLRRCRIDYLHKKLQVVDECQRGYLVRVGTSSLYRGNRVSRQLAAFRRFRLRLRSELARAEMRQTLLAARLSRLEFEEEKIARARYTESVPATGLADVRHAPGTFGAASEPPSVDLLHAAHPVTDRPGHSQAAVTPSAVLTVKTP